MRIVIAGALSLACIVPAAAQPRSPDYMRGYYDCQAGRYDEDSDNRSYRRGCRDAQREQADGGDYGGPPPGGWGPPSNQRGWNGGPPPNPGGWNDGPPPNRRGWNGDPGPGGRPRPMGPAMGLPNVRGMETTQATAAMASRGFMSVGAQGVGAAIVGFYFNGATGECAQLAFTNGRVADARLVGSNPRCR